MGSLSDYAENKIIDHILGVSAYTSPTNIYLALSTADPTDAGSGMAEPVGNGYTRAAISFGAAASRQVAQDADVNFPQASGSWGTITHWAIYDASTSGNILAHGAFSSGKSIINGNTPSVASGQLTISVSAGKMSTYLANAVLDHLFNNSSYTQPSIYVALVETTELVDSDTGATIDELDMTGYARVAKTAGGTDWGAASGGASDNLTLIDFGSLTGTGETVTAACLTDNATKGAGNVLFYDNTPSQPVGDGDTVQFPIGDFNVSLD